MSHPIEHFREFQGLAVQSSIFLTKGEIEPFQKRGAHVLYVNVLRIYENDSLLCPYHSLSLPNFDYPCIAQLGIRFHNRLTRSISMTSARHFRHTMARPFHCHTRRNHLCRNSKKGTSTFFSFNDQRIFASPYIRLRSMVIQTIQPFSHSYVFDDSC